MRRPLLARGLLLPLLLAAVAPAQPRPADPLPAAQAALDQGRSDEALRLIEPLLKREGKNARALLVRSTAWCMEGDLERCKADLDRALALDPTLRQGWLNRSALAIADKRYDDALAALAEAEMLDPRAADNGLNQGAVELLAGRLEPATAQFRRYLDRDPAASDAWYLVATNFAFSGYAALAVQHLERAVALDERQRARARADANFADLANHAGFQRLLSTDAWQAPAGSSTAARVYPARWEGSSTPLLVAVLNALQVGGTPMSSRVEVTDEWALLWADVRIKLVKASDATTRIELTAPPGKFAGAAWEERSQELFSTIELELLKLRRQQG
jgi:tetratricopeptide (TPR) repeat protein